MNSKKFPPGTRVKLRLATFKGLAGTVVDVDDSNLDPPPKNPFSKSWLYVLLDDLSMFSHVHCYPYASCSEIDITPLEEEKGDSVTVQKSEHDNVCSSCGNVGEWIAGALKCPNCWKVW
jgi:hypothetical protein